MNLRFRRLTIILLIIMLLVVACGGDDAPASDAEPSPTVSPLLAPENSPLPTPEPQGSTSQDTMIAARDAIPELTYQQPRPLAKPGENEAVVAGRVVARFGDKSTYEPVMLSAVYLAPVLVNDEGVPTVASLNSTSDPSSSTDPDGYFMFEHIAAGQYGFVIYYGVTHYLIRDEAGEQMLITVEPGQTLDLGLIKTDLPDTW